MQDAVQSQKPLDSRRYLLRGMLCAETVASGICQPSSPIHAEVSA